MKKIKLMLVAVLLMPAMFLFNGCDTVENLETLPLNIPMSFNFAMSGSTFPITQIENYCLEDNPTYNDFKNKIDSISFVEMSARIDTLSSNTLVADVMVKLETASGVLLYSYTQSSVALAQWKTTPFTFALSAADIMLIDNFLRAIGQRCLKATATVSNITGGTAPYKVGLKVDVLLRAKAKL